MKTLIDYVRTFAHLEGSMAKGYFMEDMLGFYTKYLSRYTATRRRVWDANEEQSMYDEVLEGSGERRKMEPQRHQWMQNFVIESIGILEGWRRYCLLSLKIIS
jgi:hypothetical protein